MSRKRRVFDINMPEDGAGSPKESFPAGKESAEPLRRGPMAAAVAETVETGLKRQEVERQIRAENDALAHEHVRLKRLGLVMQLVPLAEIESKKLVRDRISVEDPELGELTASISAIGLSNPVRLEARKDGRFELIQGFRRLEAFRVLLAETSDEDLYGAIPAVVLPRGEDIGSLYRKMVDENLVRKDISFAEMAQLARSYSSDPNTPDVTAEKAVASLFESAGYQKRSYIRSFIPVMEKLEKYISFPAAIPRALGIELARGLQDGSLDVASLVNELGANPDRAALDEIEILRRHTRSGEPEVGVGSSRGSGARTAAKAKTSFQFARPEGRARCVAGQGKLEVRLDKDFSAHDRRRLEAAVNALLDVLER